MSQLKATPGPWQRSGVRVKLGEHDCLAVGPDGFSIAFLPIGRRPNEQAGAIADARLIAAAPELYGQLESAQTDLDLLRRAIEENDPKAELLIRVTDLWKRNEAALAKARGEQ